MNYVHLYSLKKSFFLLVSLFTCQFFAVQLSNPLFAETISDPINRQPKLVISQTNPNPDEVPIQVKRIDIIGSTILSASQIEQLTSPLINKSAKLSQIREIADKITKIYQDGNFITSRAFIPPQDIKDGIVTIQVVEGKLERIDIKRAGDVEGRLVANYIRDRAALGAATPVNFTRLEEELQLLRADPLIADIKANLTSGSTSDQNVLQITFSEAKTFSVRPFFDNYGNSSTGIYRIGTSVQEANLTGNGDSIYASYTRSGSSDNYGLGYSYPVNPAGGTLSLNFSIGQSPITEPPFDKLNLATKSQTLELGYRQPIVRSIYEEFALALSFAFENSSSSFGGRSFNFQNFLFDDGDSQARVLRLTQEYIRRDNVGAWAFRSVFNFGLNTFGATIRNDGSPDGRFFYWGGQALRVQQLGEDKDTLATFRLNVQFSGDRLLSLNRFSIGGAQSVRGYRQSQLVGDNGVQGSLEFQFPAVRDPDGVAIVKVLPFIEAGTVWNSRNLNVGTQSLLGIGVGATYQPIRNITLRLDYGIPLINVGNAGTNLQDSGIYFSVSGNF
ncbi:MAG: ShlB/FhaC/HecB family hemolysin secretion/activation protein [Pseudanabaena frigida]|uniref:ShlB/FhaC/HecB family hemolysin secretion/activation protein n=1 Tax=Pseudanabaena frigida TaxID=945775 RepID=A0A2W4XW31_9CYAN|nr:MAG: ShlB/FhaC/HecB family hemolysin secretion/activation protein [Pseudanabaena frigida]